mgnify:CR=1 FL=1
MRPIDADEFDTKLFNDGFFGGLAACIGNTPRKRKFTIGEFRGMLKKAPTIDAVPVVRCKDCMFRCEPIEFGELYCPILNGSMNNDDFCSYGERKESNE